MESIVSQGSDELIPSLDFSIGSNSASYVISREFATFFSSQNLVSSGGVRVAKWQLSSVNSFLDLSSLYFVMRLTNKSSAPIQFLGAEGWCMFNRFMSRVSGTLVDDIDNFALGESIARRLLPLEKQENLSQMFLGHTASGTGDGILKSPPLGVGESRLVMFRPMTSAILNMSKMFPGFLLGSAGLELSMTLADPNESTLSSSSSFELSDLRAICETVQVDSQLVESYTRVMLEGRSLFLDLNSIDHTTSFLPSGQNKFNVTSSRTFSRLNTLIAVLQQEPSTGTNVSDIATRLCNQLYQPASTAFDIESHITIAGTRMPLFSNRGVEHFVRFLRGTGLMAGLGTSTAIGQAGFFGTVATVPANNVNAVSCLFVSDTERMPSNDHTGLPLDAGNLLTIFFDKVGTTSAEAPSRVVLQYHYSTILELSNGGATFYS